MNTKVKVFHPVGLSWFYETVKDGKRKGDQKSDDVLDI